MNVLDFLQNMDADQCREALASIVDDMYRDNDDPGRLDPEREWTADTLNEVAHTLANYGLVPTEAQDNPYDVLTKDDR